MGTVETGTLSQLLLAIPLQISAGCRCCWSQSRMKILLLAAALVSQVVGRPQQGEYQPGNGWGNTRPAQPTQWSAWSSGGGAAPTSYNSYDSYNSYNPYNPYNSYVPGGNKQPYLRSNSYDSYIPGGNKQPYLRSGDSVSGSVGGPAIQDIGLNNQGSLPDVETTRGDMGEPQMAGNVDEYQGWNTLPARPSFNPEPSFPGGFAQPSSPCSGGARPSPCGTGRCPSPWGGAHATALAYAHATACSYAHACSYAPAYATWELWLWGLWPNATAKQMSTGFWTSDGSSSWPNCNNRMWCLRQRYAHLWGSVKWMDAREQLDDQTLASAARTHAYAHA